MATSLPQRATHHVLQSVKQASRYPSAHLRPHVPLQHQISLTARRNQATSTSSTTAKPSTGAASTPRPAVGAARPPTTTRTESNNPPQPPIADISKQGLSDSPSKPPAEGQDWTTSFHGLSTASFPPDVARILLEPLAADDIEVKPDGIVYLPEIKYRRILNRAFGPGGWGLAPRGETIVTSKSVTREYALLANGRLVSIARGEQDYFEPDGIPTATEGCKSNALMRCCKDLGVASELWDPRFIRRFMKEHAKEVWVEHVVNKKKRKIHIRKDDEVRYPYTLSKAGSA